MRVQVHVVVRLTESRKETRLSLTNRAMHLCKCNGVADLKHVSHTYYRAKFGRSALKGVGINTEEPKNWGARWNTALLGCETWLTPKYTPLPTSKLTWIDDSINVRSIATMDISRTVSEINGDFSRKSQIFLTPGVFDAPAGVSSLSNSASALWVKT